MKRSLRSHLVWVAVGVLLLAGACSDNDDEAFHGLPGSTAEGSDDTATEAAVAPELVPYCDAVLVNETLPDPDLDSSSSNEDAAAWVEEELKPTFEAMVEEAPSELLDDLSIQMAAVENAAATGEFSYFGDEEVQAAVDRTHAFDLASCGWNEQPVEATEYSYGDVPDTLPAGPTSFELTNAGDEVHEIVIARKNPGVTESATEILALPTEEATSKITELGSVYTDPDESDYRVVDLEPGDYIMVCFVPVGMTSTDALPPEGPPHHTEGMIAELTVT